MEPVTREEFERLIERERGRLVALCGAISFLSRCAGVHEHLIGMLQGAVANSEDVIPARLKGMEDVLDLLASELEPEEPSPSDPPDA